MPFKESTEERKARDLITTLQSVCERKRERETEIERERRVIFVCKIERARERDG